VVEHRLTECDHEVEVASWDGHIICVDCGHVRIAQIDVVSLPVISVRRGGGRPIVTDVADLGLVGVHSPDACAPQYACPMHRPTEHHMRGWEVVWRADRGILERVCAHGVGHPDPDQFSYWKANGMEAEAVHGCCGCCTGAPKYGIFAGQDTI
jgi:hypothetical protein